MTEVDSSGCGMSCQWKSMRMNMFYERAVSAACPPIDVK